MSDQPDTSNAHVRTASRREDPEVISGDAQRLLDDPAFQRGFDVVRNGLVTQLEAIKHDGSRELVDYEREICRSLRTLSSVKRAIIGSVQGQTLRLAGFKPVTPETED